MIEIVTDKERNLKNLRQIGTPREENKIYIENMAYVKIREASYKDKRVFVLMGHTERMEGHYATFVEGVIPVREIDFAGNIPRWNNSTWSEIFREIKRLYEDMIIVGWAIDIKGMAPKVTPELERVHKEHFGGVHQILFLLDTMEQEETFYMYKENKIVPKDGFYIYHRARKKENVDSYERKKEPIPVTVLPTKAEKSRRKMPEVDIELDIEEMEPVRGGRYRQLMQEKKTKKVSDDGNIGVAIAVAMLVFVVGVGVYENRNEILGNQTSIETNMLQDETMEESTQKENQDTESSADAHATEDIETAVDVIPVDVVPGTEQQE